MLRMLCGSATHPPELSLGIVWYLAPDDTQNDNGKHVRYLRNAEKNSQTFRACDPALYDALGEIVSQNDRRVARIQEMSVFAPGTVFYDAPLTSASVSSVGPAARRARIAHRQAWAQGALEATQTCDIVFVDPDNGLEVQARSHQKNGPKYAYFDELAPYTARGQSLVIYQHIARNGTAEEQVMARLSEIARRLERGSEAFALHYHRGTARVFFVVPAPAHGELLLRRADTLLQSPWGSGEEPHFSIHLGT